jgi:ribose-phosphate pyrophosphokinase
MYEPLKVFSGSSHPEFVKKICSKLNLTPGDVYSRRFSNDNIKVKINENVRNDDVYVVQTGCTPVNEYFMELLIMVDALRYASAGRITVVMPYYFYSRSDKKDEPRISVVARLVADLLETAGADRILTMTLHSPQIMGFPRIPMDQLLPTQVMLDHFRSKDLRNAVIAVPDVGGAKSMGIYSKALNLPMVILEKQRLGDQEKVVINNIIGDAKNKDVLILDDEILSGGSMLESINYLQDHGANKIFAGCTHGFFTKEALVKFNESAVEEIVVTNTVPPRNLEICPKVKVLCVAELFANAIQAIHEGDSVGALFWVPGQEL